MNITKDMGMGNPCSQMVTNTLAFIHTAKDTALGFTSLIYNLFYFDSYS